MADNFTSPSTGVHERAQEYMRTIALAKETAVKQAKETIEAKWGPSPKAEPDTAIAEKPTPFKKTVMSSKQKAIANMESPTHAGMIAGAGQITPQRLLQPLIAHNTCRPRNTPNSSSQLHQIPTHLHPSPSHHNQPTSTHKSQSPNTHTTTSTGRTALYHT